MKEQMKPSVKLELITPQKAQEYLESNTKNRKISQPMVKRIAQSIVNDNFVTTNIGIGFDREGTLTDGQQRLSAVIEAQKPVYMFVMRNLEPKARLVVDTGVKRSHANSLQMLGIGIDVKPNGKGRKDYTKLLASVSAYIILHQTNRFNMIQAFGHVITNDEIVDFVSKNEEELMTSVKTTTKLTANCKYVENTHMFFIYQMHKFFNKSRITEFINIVCGNENSANPELCPAHRLRETLQANAIKKFGTKFNTKDLLGLTIDASNRFMNRQEMRSKSEKLNGRPNSTNLITIQFISEPNEKATEFFNTINLPKKD